MGIKLGPLSVIYCWKAYHIGFQKIYVGRSVSVTSKSYCTSSQSLLFQQVDVLEKSGVTIVQFLCLKA